MRWSCRLPERALCWCLGFPTGRLVVLCPLVNGLSHRSAGGPLSLGVPWLHPALNLVPGCPALVPGAAGGQAVSCGLARSSCSVSCPTELQCMMVMSGSCSFLTSGEKVNIDPWNPTQTEAPLHPEPGAPMLRRTLPQHSVRSVWPRIAC